MRPLVEARSEVLAALPSLPTEEIAVTEALGRVTAAPVVSRTSVPPFANSAMDGFAVRSEDTADAPRTLRIIDDVPAGSVPSVPVGPGTATRIMTGAPMPQGADAVAMVEITTSVDDDHVEIAESVPSGTAVRAAGSDVEPGDVLVAAGVRLTPRHLASIASVTGSIEVARRPTVAIMSTGDELLAPGDRDLAPGQIRDTNRVMLAGVLAELGVEVIDLGIVGDDLEALRAAFLEAADRADVIVSTGGVSMGDHDFVKHVLGEQGTVAFWRVAMQPAKPFAFGHVAGIPLFGLPGNPVSTFVAFEQFVRPGLLSMMGATAILRPRVMGTMGEDVTTSIEKEVFLRVLLADDDGAFVAVRAGAQGSHVMSGLADAMAFAVVPVGVEAVAAGDRVILEMFEWPETREAE